MKDKNRTNLIYSMLSLVATSFLLVVTIFAWYVSNSNVGVKGISASTSNDKIINILDDVTAERHNLNGNVITDSYKRSSTGTLYLVKRKTRDVTVNPVTETTVEYTLADAIGFNIEQMLPGEYVDITVGYKLTDGHDGRDYSIRLNNVNGQSFIVDEKIHYSTGAFKYAPISLETKSGTTLFDYSSSVSYNWFNAYSISANDEVNTSPVLLNHSWQSSYQELYFTFRITEDFTQYYELISQASGSYGALLSTLKFTIGDIYFTAL